MYWPRRTACRSMEVVGKQLRICGRAHEDDAQIRAHATQQQRAQRRNENVALRASFVHLDTSHTTRGNTCVVTCRHMPRAMTRSRSGPDRFIAML